MPPESRAEVQGAVSRGRAAATSAFFAQGFVFAVVLTHLGAFKERWGIDDLAITVIMFVVALLAAVGSVVAGWLAPRFGSAGALRFGLVTLALGVLGAALAPSFVVFCVALGVYGLALGCVDATTNMQAVACEAMQGRSILTSFHGSWSAGGILGALETSGTGSAGWSLAVALAPVAVVPLIAAATPLLPARLGLPTGPTELPVAGGAARVVAIPWRPMLVLGAAIVLFYVADSATQSWSTIYLHDVLLASAGVAPLGYAAYQATSLVARLAGDHLVRRVGPVRVVRLAATVGAVGLLAALLAHTPWVAIVGFAVLGVGIAVVAPLSFAAAGQLASVDADGNPIADPVARRATADAIVARVNQFNYLGFVLGGVLTGLVASGSTMRAGFIVPLVGVALILPIARGFAVRRAHPIAGQEVSA
ncbi:MAG: hypothetical protein BGO26_02590 [Actinobacteria bacterium 69-20]|nr:MFS transporter [Actinomycetota bacterium]OJV30895.1 MAG: hypothetical protein BGO26_02590 [Actinobacteria bacterium 69-20]